MSKFLKTGKDFKIIPDKFVDATTFDIKKIDNDGFIADLKFLSTKQLATYTPGNEVEIFGSSDSGLIYFTTKILSKDNHNLKLAMPDEHKNIQRREYSRISFNSELKVLNLENFAFKTIDISAGGMKFYSNSELKIGEEYQVVITLTNNLEINCTIQVIRIHKENPDVVNYTVSSRFKEIKSIDRIALAQYTFKTLTEEENKNQ